MVDWTKFETRREQLGANFARLLSYFSEDGFVSVEKIEQAMHKRVSVDLVMPAHTLKGEALEFGAEPLAELAEKIEMNARHFVEVQQSPDEILPDVAALRPLFDATLKQLNLAINPLIERAESDGNREPSNQKFGRL
jgi:HPt (histidine-containing phosphotransfer) domain-containing protein